MDYSDTVHLPRTDFPMRANLPDREPAYLRRWQEEDLYETLQENRRDAEPFVLHDGPPYANGDIHIGHALNKILKDILVKFKTMRGFRAPYRPGWDCHGLPIEHHVTSEQPETAEEGAMAVREACREYSLHYVDVQREQFKRLGVLGEWENPYLTLSPDYEAEILRSFRALVEDGFVYRQHKPIHWCWECETALAEAEVEYDEITSPAIYVDFPVIEDPDGVLASDDARCMIWTTTPWTIPANVAIAVHPDLTYLEVEDPEGEVHLLAERLLAPTMDRRGWTTADVTILREHDGRDLAGLTAAHPLIEDRASSVVTAEMVTLEQGTGCVHIAPGHGQEDYQIGEKHGLPVLSPVGPDGTFTEEYPPQEGVHVLTADEDIVEELDGNGALFHSETLDHSYPFCWRCKKPIIFRATPQWFMDVDHEDLRGRVLDALPSVHWVPERGEQRFRAMIEDRPDWCLSRQRDWGVPIPALTCEGCGEAILDTDVMDRLIDRVRKEGVNVWFEGTLDDLLPEGFACPECGSDDLRRQEDILDVWFDSGVSHQAVLRQDPDLAWPADVYLEGSDQHRGWFQLSMLPAVALEGSPPFREIITHGFVVDDRGRKMSKSEGNVVSPQEVVEEYGADVLRLWVATENYQEDLVMGEELLEQVADKYRRIRNTCKFFLGNLQDFEGFDPETDGVDPSRMPRIDRWFLGELYGLVRRVSRAYQARDFHVAIKEINNFCTVEASALYLDIAKDRLYCEPDDKQSRRSAQTVLDRALRVLTRLIAPVLSFTAEEIWDVLDVEDSVHAADWPDPPSGWADDALIDDFEGLRRLRRDVTKAIEEHDELNDTDPARVTLARPSRQGLLDNYESLLAEWFIVAEVRVDREADQPYVSVEHAGYEKCERCWRFRPDVSERDDYDGDPLCDRCLTVIEETPVGVSSS